MKRSILTTFLILSAGIHQHLFSDTLIVPDTTHFNYYGRFDFTDPSAPAFNWSGATIEARFLGPVVGVRLTDGNADYDIEIDGVLDTIIRSTNTNAQKHSIRTNLTDAPHTIRVIQRSENHWYIAHFNGLYLANGKTLLSPPDKPKKKIEFVGDSYTVGYGNESPKSDCDNSNIDTIRKYTNTNRSFPALITNTFYAQSTILGWSGAGVVRNYGASGKRSPDPYPVNYDKMFGAADTTVKWNFNRWIPDLVVICLGTNDYSTPWITTPDDSMYIYDYHKFINRILGNYPDVPIFCVTTHTQTMDSKVKKVVAEQKTMYIHPKVYYSEFPNSLAYTGCDGHPSVKSDSAIAKALIKNIMDTLGWDTTAITAVHEPSTISRSAQNQFTIITSPNAIQILSQSSMQPGTVIRMINAHGQTVFQENYTASGTIVWNTSNIVPGVYFVGNRNIGWEQTVVKNW